MNSEAGLCPLDVNPSKYYFAELWPAQQQTVPVGVVAAERDLFPYLTAQMDWNFQRHGYHPLS